MDRMPRLDAATRVDAAAGALEAALPSPQTLAPAAAAAHSKRSAAADAHLQLDDAPGRELGGAEDPLDDTALMLRYGAGDVRAFEVLYARHKAPVYRYLRRMCRDTQIADDLFQEVWSKVIASRERYEVRAQFKTYLFRIAHNCVVDHFRRSGRDRVRLAHDVDELAEQLPAAAHERPDAQLAQAQMRAQFRRALEALPAEQRDVFVLYEETGLSLDAIGQVTGVAMETAKSRLRYALAKLRAALEPHRQPHETSDAPGRPTSVQS